MRPGTKSNLNTNCVNKSQVVYILKRIENERNSFLFLAISHNQCSRPPTDPAGSQDIFLESLSNEMLKSGLLLNGW